MTCACGASAAVCSAAAAAVAAVPVTPAPTALAAAQAEPTAQTPTAPTTPGLAELAVALEARELLYELFLCRARGRRAADADRARLSRLAAEAFQAASLDEEPDGRLGWRWDPSRLASVRHVAIATAVELLSQSPTARLRQCPGDHCGWFFLDTTKRGNRRWCSMSECGQEAKTRRRRQRSTAHAPGGAG